MNYLADTTKKTQNGKMDILKLFTFIVVLIFPYHHIAAQSDAFGQTDRFYIDSVVAGPGQDIPVHFNLENDEPLSSISVPLKYDPNILTLKSISFSDSRAEYISNKVITPIVVEEINGHFLMGMFILFEDPIPSGDGLIFTAIFNVSPTVPIGTSTVIDTLFYPPGGEMILVEAESSGIIEPEFTAGKIIISRDNHTPVISSIPVQYVFEGESLVLDITANDADNDSLVIVCTDKPAGVVFTDNNNGTAAISWQPDFIGPYSSDGSPFELSLWVSDGDLSTEKEITINVVNKNRKPVISVENSYEFESGDLIEFSVSAEDPDFEPIIWEVNDLPLNAQLSSANPALFSWATTLTDTGTYEVTLIASDPQGFADTSQLNISLKSSAIYELYLDTISGDPGEIVDYNVNLDNKFPIGSFNLLVRYDQTVLTVTGITNSDTRASDFEIYNPIIDENSTPGNIRIVGVVDQSGTSSEPLLTSGNGSVGKISFRIISNITYGGMIAPVRFIFLDDLTLDDNTLTDTLGVKIEQNSISYLDGYVGILEMGTILTGDINLNGIAFDIGDAIYFTNYFMNPYSFPLNPLQYANSDINQDSYGGTIGDLVALINVIISGSNYTGKNTGINDLTATVSLEMDIDGTHFISSADFEVGAILITINRENFNENINFINLTDQMTLDFYQDESAVRLLIYSLDGKTILSGVNDLVKFENADTVIFSSIEMASSDGQMVEINIASKNQNLPEEFVLFQNYPNPFNPETNITFSLPKSEQVKITVFNILGEKVKILIDKEMSAGTHSIIWDSRDENGSAVASGIYLYRLVTTTENITRKMVLLK